MKLTTHFHLVPRSRMVELYLQCVINCTGTIYLIIFSTPGGMSVVILYKLILFGILQM
jgi:hypothetical protein